MGCRDQVDGWPLRASPTHAHTHAHAARRTFNYCRTKSVVQTQAQNGLRMPSPDRKLLLRVARALAHACATPDPAPESQQPILPTFGQPSNDYFRLKWKFCDGIWALLETFQFEALPIF